MTGWEGAIIGGLLGTIWLWSYLAFSMREEHSPIKLLLLLMSFLGMGVVLFVTKQIADLNDAAIASIVEWIFVGYMWIFIFVIWYFIITFIIHVINLIRVKQ
jgi:hypothetical protein